uniref:Uncharacterized protein n=1 Tax=Siphoviridae sp. ctZHD14 TaxID=2827891 RepID=A0A8S5SVV7_9CAUD|nr:MAG TPA: hypothetical protein [Siphoviridae sp. ctZHD14]
MDAFIIYPRAIFPLLNKEKLYTIFLINSKKKRRENTYEPFWYECIVLIRLIRTNHAG